MDFENMNGKQLSNALLDVSLDDTSVPEPYVMPDHILPKVAHDEFGHKKLPVIDLGAFQSCEGPQYEGIVSQLADVCENWGFFHVVNHCVKLELLKRVEAASLRFFALPLEVKQKVAAHFAGDCHLGHGFLKSRTSMRAWSEGVILHALPSIQSSCGLMMKTFNMSSGIRTAEDLYRERDMKNISPSL